MGKSMIYNVRGTNGSGKTTIGRSIIEKAKAIPYAFRKNGKKVEAYDGTLVEKRIAVLGSYEAVCGGMDTVSDINEAADMILKYANDKRFDIVFYEGLFISHMIGTVGAAVKPLGERLTLAYLDTPLEECIRRVNERRHARGQGTLEDPSNIVKDHRSVARCRNRCIQEGFRVVDLPHADPLPVVLKHLKSGITKPVTNMIQIAEIVR